MRTIKYILPISIILTLTLQSFGEIALYAVYPNCFDYLFKGKSSTKNGQPVLSFNTLEDETIFSTIGEKIGDYTIISYARKFDKEFIETTSSYKDKDVSTVILESPDGKQLELTVDQPKTIEGLLAAFVNKENGYFLYAKDNDKLDYYNDTYTINKVMTNSATISCNGIEKLYEVMSGDMKKQMFANLEKKAKEQADIVAAEKEAAYQKAQEENIKSTTRVVNKVVSQESRYASSRPAKTTTKVILGTEYVYPIKYAVFPVTKRNSQGNLYFTPVAVPTEFQRGYTGYQSYDNGGRQINVIRR
ncbi:MAG: hypothetical protein PF692_11760 [Kiritimatiellae bacterium]|jgi:hypothetical protein|nr:hypothetical protein [Kiritimatiellia bacterium]